MTESTLTSLERASARLYADCMAQWPTDTEVLGAVDDAGWLLEHHAARTLDAADTHPRLGWAYPDPDEPTNSRELDVWSYKEVLRSDEMKLTVSARFLVECKQSSQPIRSGRHPLNGDSGSKALGHRPTPTQEQERFGRLRVGLRHEGCVCGLRRRPLEVRPSGS